MVLSCDVKRKALSIRETHAPSIATPRITFLHARIKEILLSLSLPKTPSSLCGQAILPESVENNRLRIGPVQEGKRMAGDKTGRARPEAKRLVESWWGLGSATFVAVM